jgi:preprotein translocase subunit SecD
MITRLALVGLGLLAASGGAPQERAPGVKRLVFVLEVDADRAREVGWTGASRAEVLELVAKLVERRFVAMERAARVEVWRDAQRIEVSLPSIDPRDRELFEQMLRSIGLCELFIVVDGDSTRGLDIDLEAERAKLEAWRKANQDQPIAAFQGLYPEQQGPHARLAWFETSFGEKPGPPLPVLLPDKPEDHIGAASFSRVETALDPFGYPSIAFELSSSRATDFARITEAHLNQRLGILVEGRIRSAPPLNSKLTGRGVIEGPFTDEEATGIAETLTKLQGPLRVVEIR